MKVVVLGGGYAGVAAALRVKRRAGDAVEVILVNTSEEFVERIRMHQAATGQRLRRRPLEKLLARGGVRFVAGRAEEIDPAARRVRVGRLLLPYDRLVVALGSHPMDAKVPGVQHHAWRLEPARAAQLAERLRGLAAGSRVVVVGAGLSGVEAATEIAERHPRLRVSLVSRAEPLPGWAPVAREHVRRVLGRLEVEVRQAVEVVNVSHEALELAGGGRIAFDLCVWASGFAFPSLAGASGLAVDGAGRVRVDGTLRSVSHRDVYAAGDIAVVEGAPDIPLGCKTALPLGAHAGDNLARDARGEALLPFDFAVTFFCVSLGRRDGLVQWPVRGGALAGRTWTGRRAAWMKELICKATYWGLEWEARGWDGVAWRQGEDRPIAPSAGLRGT